MDEVTKCSTCEAEISDPVDQFGDVRAPQCISCWLNPQTQILQQRDIRLIELEDEIKELDEEISSKERDIEDLEGEVDELKSERAKLRAELREAMNPKKQTETAAVGPLGF